MGGCSKKATSHAGAQSREVASRQDTKAGREVGRGTPRSVSADRKAQGPGEGALPLRRCFPTDTPLSAPRCPETLLERAASRFDAGDYETALVCATEAAREHPELVEAHLARASALAQMGRMADARDAVTRALALEPLDPDTLVFAADLYVNRLAPSVELTEIGLVYAERASRMLRGGERRELAARAALLEGQALNDLGRASEALPRIEQSLRWDPENLEAKYERGVSLFETCRFEEARAAFEAVLAREPRHAYAHHYLGLTLERFDEKQAAQHFAKARTLRPQDFQEPLRIAPEDFKRLVDDVVRELPPDARESLQRVPLEIADLPSLADLVAEQPPLSPTILGMFRGTPEGATCKPAPGIPVPPRTIVLYRRNLLRVASSLEELRREIRVTLLHEIGHLHGEDDASLRARGLD